MKMNGAMNNAIAGITRVNFTGSSQVNLTSRLKEDTAFRVFGS